MVHYRIDKIAQFSNLSLKIVKQLANSLQPV